MATHGLHLVWTTYGTWLPGDSRGNWSALLDLWGGYLGRRHTQNSGDERTHLRAMELMKAEEFVLTDGEQQCVARSIGSVVGSTPIRAIAIERTHVHLQIDPIHVAVGTFMGRLKGKSSSAILAMRPGRSHRRIWTSGYCVKFLDCDEAVIAVQDYIEAHNVERGLPSAPWSFIQPFLR